MIGQNFLCSLQNQQTQKCLTFESSEKTSRLAAITYCIRHLRVGFLIICVAGNTMMSINDDNFCGNYVFNLGIVW